jgi:hypothetical protein
MRRLSSLSGLAALLALAALSVLLTSCTVETTVVLESDGSGTAGSRVSMAPLFRRYLGDLAQMQGAEVSEETSYFDVPALAAAFDAAPGVDLAAIVNPEPSVLELLFGFRNAEEIFPEELESPQNPVIRMGRDGDLELLTISIDTDNVAAVIGIVPFGDDPVSQTLTGMFESGGSASELREMLIWVFEEYAPPKEIAAMIDGAAITLKISVPGRLVGVDGGIIRGSDTAEFRIPLIRFMSLTPPIEYRLRYRLEE